MAAKSDTSCETDVLAIEQVLGGGWICNAYVGALHLCNPEVVRVLGEALQHGSEWGAEPRSAGAVCSPVGL